MNQTCWPESPHAAGERRGEVPVPGVPPQGQTREAEHGDHPEVGRHGDGDPPSGTGPLAGWCRRVGRRRRDGRGDDAERRLILPWHLESPGELVGRDALNPTGGT